ncbi:MAG: hypothetical protein K0R24_1241 [Gammaproteobacteria bacterium]|jgi:hypothetical protein|nr:hypothetical protein [Gammaproteobacteria bacterium]
MNPEAKDARKRKMFYMNRYKVIVKRVEEFYQTVFVEARSQEDAYEKVGQMSSNNEIQFDYLKESDCLEKSIVDVKKL